MTNRHTDCVYIERLISEILQEIENINFDDDEEVVYASINRMITYIQEHEKYDHNSLGFIEAIGSFVDVLSNPDFMKEYIKLDKLLYDLENYFYTEIFESTDKYDKAIDEVTNILENGDDEK